MSECNHECSSCSSNDCGERAVQKAKPHEMSHIKKVIGVVSGKGGVGKSLVTSMLAVKMNRAGFKTAILDADVTGPSIPKSFGITKKALATEMGIFPVQTKTDISVMSLNLILENDTDPVIWRGPIIAGAVTQFWTDVVWGDIDYMFVDMPPGTGDVPLTVFQSLPVDGIIVVASPQELVGMIVEKAVKMADMMHIPVLGLVENMSYFKCPDCGKQHNIFGESHIGEIAENYGIKTICKLPIDPEIAKSVDAGNIEDMTFDYLDDITKMLAALDSDEPSGQVLRVAVTYENGQIFQHFGHTEAFKIYHLENGQIISSEIVPTNGSGHGALAGFLAGAGVNILICGGIGGGAKDALAQAGITLYGGASGDADEAVKALLNGTLNFNPDVACSHHDENHHGECGDHGCGEHSCH